LTGGAWHPDSGVPRFRGLGALPRIGVPGILSGSATREKGITKRAVSDDFWSLNEPREEGARAQRSSERALLGSTPGEAGLDTASDFPWH
jgi:hypothetical protein